MTAVELPRLWRPALVAPRPGGGRRLGVLGVPPAGVTHGGGGGGGVRMTATLERKPRPDLGEDVVQYTIDCAHGTTGGLAAGVPAAWERVILGLLLARHDREEGPRGCRCTVQLWARLRATGGWN